MIDKLIVSETPGLALEADGLGGWKFFTDFVTGYRPFITGSTTAWVYEDQIDLTGYTMQDMTTYFRQSFEQTGATRSCQWTGGTKPLASFNAVYFEMTLVTTVPLSDDNLTGAILYAPGFVPTENNALDYGNFDREHVIHGRLCAYGLDSAVAADDFSDSGGGYNRIIQEYDFSSLEPVAVDKLYVYRLFAFSSSFELGGITKLDVVNIPPKRIIIDAKFDAEAEIPYLMRLKRGYELANQV